MGPAGLPSSLAGVQRPIVMGVLNVAPDSFSDGGRYARPDAAVEHARRLIEAGADLIDVGGESTRPGAAPVLDADEQARIIPVISALTEQGIAVSVDTMHASTARAAVAAGACIVNDVSGGLADERMLATIADLDVACVLMHWRGPSELQVEYAEVVTDVRDALRARVDAAVAVGVDPAHIVLDPGLGFAKAANDNWALLQRLDVLVETGYPVLVGASRKRFLGSLLADESGVARPVDERDAATDAITALSAAAGAWAVRVHRVDHARDAVLVGHAWRRGHA